MEISVRQRSSSKNAVAAQFARFHEPPQTPLASICKTPDGRCGRVGAILCMISDGAMSLSAIIVDDEQLARDELAYLLQSIGEVDVIAQGKNGVEGVNLIKEHAPDLIFLDVQMPGLDGFGVIKKLLDRKVPMPQIVFATAFDQYAVKAFEVNAIDYLLKPFDKKRVSQAVEKARKKLDSSASPS